MTQPVDALTEVFVFFLKKKVFFVQRSLFLPEPPEVDHAPLAKDSDEGKAGNKNGESIDDPALAVFKLRHKNRNENII